MLLRTLEYLFDNFRTTSTQKSNSTAWWNRYPERAEREIELMLKNTNAKLFESGAALIFKEKIITNFGTPYYLSIKIKDYPHKIPEVHVEKPRIKPSRKIHMYSDSGGLCLMHPSEYHSDISILEIRGLAAAWCFCHEVFLSTGEWPAAEYQH